MGYSFERLKYDNTNALPKTLDKSNRKPNKLLFDKGSEFYNRSIKSWLEKNDTEMYSTRNEEKYVVAGRFIRTLKNKVYKDMTPISQNVYIDKLDDIVNKYNNTYHRTYIDSRKEMIKILNLKLMILLEYQIIKRFLQKAVFQIILKKVLLLQNLKTLCRGHMLLVILKGEKFDGML